MVTGRLRDRIGVDQSIAIDIMLNFDGYGDGKCKQTFTVLQVLNMEGEAENSPALGEDLSGATEGHETHAEKLKTTSSTENQVSR